jgi:hypothetical protein
MEVEKLPAVHTSELLWYVSHSKHGLGKTEAFDRKPQM